MAAAITSLLSRASIDNHSEALAIADAAISASKSDLAAQHTKVVALLRLERYDDALRVIASGGTALEDRCVLEKSYALYKTGALEEAYAALHDVLDNTPGAPRALKHVAAQVAYRVERFDEAAELYSALIGDMGGANDAEDTDLKINLLATHAQLEWQGRGDLVSEKSKQPGREDLEAFETAYNAACGCVARGDLAKAAILLKRAADLCDLEDLSEEDKKMEMLPIILQQAYVHVLMGKTEEAAALQKGIEDYEASDEAIKAVAKWNSLISKSLTNPYMIERLSELLPEANTGNSRLFKHEAVGVMRNKHVIALQAFKQTQVKNSTARLLKQDPTPSTDLERVTWGCLNAAAKARLQSDQEALKKILSVLEKRPYDVGLLLTIIQFYVQAKKYDSAIDVLQRFFQYVESAGTPDHEDVRYSPGLVALAVALYRTQNRRKDIRNELGRAAAYWQRIPKNSSTTLLREAGIELLHSSKPDDLATAGAAFERLVAQNQDDKIAQAGLVASFATTDYAKVEPHLSSLSSVDHLTSGIDVSALLDAGVPAFPAPQQPAPAKKKRKVDEVEAGAETAQAQTGNAQPRTKETTKRKKPRLPKDYDPNVKPDPERWVPMRDRSYYRPKKKKGKKRAAESTQGGMVANETETLSLAGGAGQIKVERAPSGSGGGGGGGGGGKKGKKGRGKN